MPHQSKSWALYFVVGMLLGLAAIGVSQCAALLNDRELSNAFYDWLESLN